MNRTQNIQPDGKVPKSIKVIFGGIAGMATTTLVHPLDVVKVRLQLAEKPCSTSSMARRIVACEGYGALYAGLSAGLMRQATYTTTRLGVYNWLYDDYKRKYGKNPSLSDKVAIGVCAGLAGAFAGTPSEVALVRMMADGPSEPCARCTRRQHYKGLIDTLNKISREEGIFALWRGGLPTLGRSVFVSAAQIGVYAEAREIVKEHKGVAGVHLHLYTSTISSFITAVLSLPVDVVKTRYQATKEGKSQTEILSSVLKKEGVLYLWKGFLPYYVRMAFHTIVTFIILEEMNAMYLKYH